MPEDASLRYYRCLAQSPAYLRDVPCLQSPTKNPTESGCSLNDPGTFCCVDEDCGDSLVCEFGNCLAADCDTNVDECCGNGNCGEGEACVQRECVNEGDPRFSLKWTGDGESSCRVLFQLVALSDPFSFHNLLRFR